MKSVLELYTLFYFKFKMYYSNYPAEQDKIVKIIIFQQINNIYISGYNSKNVYKRYFSL